MNDERSKKLTLSEIFLVAGFLTAILPFIILSAFNHPSADDFGYANKTILFGVLANQFYEYTHWCGRYCATAFLSVNPMVFHSLTLYKLVPIVMIVGLWNGLYVCLSALIAPYAERKQIFIASLGLITLYICSMPSTASGFYWYAATVTYQLSNILALYLFALIIGFFRDPLNKRSFPKRLFCIFLVFASVGCNETSMILMILLFTVVLALSFMSDRQMSTIMIVLFIAVVLASCLMVFAPGNKFRMAYELKGDHSHLWAVKASMIHTFKSLLRWVISIPMMSLTLLFVPFAAHIAEKRIKLHKRLLIHPVFSIGFFVLSITASFLPAFWALGKNPPVRTINVIYLFFIIGWFLSVYLTVEHLIDKKVVFSVLPGYATLLLCVFLFLSFARDDNNIRAAFGDLVSARAFKYDRQQHARYDYIQNNPSDSLLVDPLSDPPTSIFVGDIASDQNTGWNSWYSDYFQKKKIELRKE